MLGSLFLLEQPSQNLLSHHDMVNKTHNIAEQQTQPQSVAAKHSVNIRDVSLTGMLSSPSSSSVAKELEPACWGSACWAAVVAVAAVVAAVVEVAEVVEVGGGGATALDLVDTDGATGCDLDDICGVPTRDFEDTDGAAACCLVPIAAPVVKRVLLMATC